MMKSIEREINISQGYEAFVDAPATGNDAD
jgi:hypothetical protein